MNLLEIGPGAKPLQPIEGNAWDTLQRPEPSEKYPAGTIAHDIGIRPWPIESGTYDLVYMSHVLEHLPWTDSIEILAEIKRILKPGGRLEIWVPDFDVIARAYLAKRPADKWTMQGRVKTYMHWVNGRIFAPGHGGSWHIACFNSEHLIYCLKAAGFTAIKKGNRPRGHDHGKINLGMIAW
jgi:SAM-dependent methyltransferase